MKVVANKLHATSIRTYFYMLERLAEPSTLRGIIMAGMGGASALKPDQIAMILAIGSVIVGLVGVLTPDAWRRQRALLDNRQQLYTGATSRRGGPERDQASPELDNEVGDVMRPRRRKSPPAYEPDPQPSRQPSRPGKGKPKIKTTEKRK